MIDVTTQARTLAHDDLTPDNPGSRSDTTTQYRERCYSTISTYTEVVVCNLGGDQMKRLVALLIAGSLVAPPALAYDEALAKTYERFFASFEEKQVPKAMHLIPPEKLITAIKNGEDLVLLDVRTRQEQSVVGVTYPGTLHMPMNEVFKPENLAQIPTDKKVVVTCQAGVRCTVIATALRNIGFENVYATKGGLAALVKYLGAKTAF
jgi:rhodanese-related sulfurtransferase